MLDRPFWIAMTGIPCLVGLSVAGCSPPAPPVQAPAPIAAPPQDPGSAPAAHPEITALWSEFWSQSWSLDQTPPSHWRPVLADLADSPLVEQLVQRKAADRARGARLYGQIQPHLSAVVVRGDQASVTDCQDASHAGRADLAGHPKTVGVAGNRVLGQLVHTPAGWRVSHVDYPGGVC